MELAKYEKPGNSPNLIILEKMMNRCFKLYNMMDDFMKIFKLIGQKKKLDL